MCVGVHMQSYSQDLRDRVLRAIERGDRPTEIANRFEVSREWIYQVRNRFHGQGIRSSFRIGGHRQSRLASSEKVIRGWIQTDVDMTLVEISDRLKKRGVDIKVSALWHQLNKWGLTYKKNSARQRARKRRRSNSAQIVD